MGYFSAIKKKKKMPFAAIWMHLQIIIVSEVSQKEKDKRHMMSLTCGIYNITQMNLSTMQKQTRRHREDWLSRGSDRDELGVWG